MAQEKKKNPWVAAILSVLIAGLGQAYLRKWKRAAAWFFSAIGLGIVLTLLNAPGSVLRIITVVIAVSSGQDAYVLAKYGSWEKYAKEKRKKK